MLYMSACICIQDDILQASQLCTVTVQNINLCSKSAYFMLPSSEFSVDVSQLAIGGFKLQSPLPGKPAANKSSYDCKCLYGRCCCYGSAMVAWFHSKATHA